MNAPVRLTEFGQQSAMMATMATDYDLKDAIMDTSPGLSLPYKAKRIILKMDEQVILLL